MAITVMGTLMTVALASYASFRQKVRISQTKTDLSTMVSALEVYRSHHDGKLPLTLDELGFGGLRDAWDNPYAYLNFSTVNGKGQMRKDHNLVPINTEFDLYSMGPDGESVGPLTAKASRDDIIVANDGAFIGVASDY